MIEVEHPTWRGEAQEDLMSPGSLGQRQRQKAGSGVSKPREMVVCGGRFREDIWGQITIYTGQRKEQATAVLVEYEGRRGTWAGQGGLCPSCEGERFSPDNSAIQRL